MKRVANKAYIHVSALEELPQGLRRRVVVAAARVPKGWSLVRIDLKGSAVMLGWTESWETEAHPQLLVSRLVVPGKPVKTTDYRTRGSRPVYHRKESMVGRDHPQRDEFAALSAAEAKAGLLGRKDIGGDKAWARALKTAGYKVVGHELVKVGKGRAARGRSAKRTKRHPTETVPIKWVKPAEGIRNTGNLENLEALFSLYAEWPDGLMPVFTLSDGTLLDGHHRLEAARRAGRSTVEAVIANEIGFDILAIERGWPRDEAFKKLTGWEWPMSWTGRGARCEPGARPVVRLREALPRRRRRRRGRPATLGPMMEGLKPQSRTVPLIHRDRCTPRQRRGRGAIKRQNKLVIVDVQPEYADAIHFSVADLVAFTESYDRVLWLFNGPELGFGDEAHLREWLIYDKGADTDIVDTIEFGAKSYGFLRDVMEALPHDQIEAIGRSMVKYDVSDWRQLPRMVQVRHGLCEGFVDRHGCGLADVEIDGRHRDLGAHLTGFQGADIAGGAEYECLDEVCLLASFYGVTFRPIHRFIY